MQLSIDHVTIAGRDLTELQRVFMAAGLSTQYGGSHSNQVTHMAVAAFEDGSYVELISTVMPCMRSPWWHAHIIGDAGPCGWAVRVDDVMAEVHRLRERGVTVNGPITMARARPDGKTAEWDLAFVGDGDAGVKLPFIIKDRTSRDWRVSPPAATQANLFTGVRTVVLAVRDLDTTIKLFRDVYDWAAPLTRTTKLDDATVAQFAHTPVVLASPNNSLSWLAKRIDVFGECPAAYVLSARDVKSAMRRHGLGEPTDRFGLHAAWFPHEHLAGIHLGVAVGEP